MTDRKDRISKFMLVLAGLCCVSFVLIAVHKPKIPAGIDAVLREKYPNSSVTGLHPKGDVYQIYEVGLMGKDGTMTEMLIDQDGVVINIETKVKSAELPFDIQTVLPKNAKVDKIARTVKYTEVKPIKLDAPETKYEIIAIVDGEEVEIKTKKDGTVIKK